MSQSLSDDQLIRYLLGALPADEAERLDERTVADDDLAERLRLVEDDLVDAYAAGTLTGDRLQQFESFYLASPHRRKKAAFAKGLRGAVARSTQGPIAVPKGPVRASHNIGRAVWWPLATAAAVVLAIGILFLQNVSLRRQLDDSVRQAVVAGQRATVASQQFEAEQKSAAAAKQALADVRTAVPLATVALVLVPQTRGVTSVPIIAVPPGSSAVLIQLALEVPGGESYDVALRDPATNRTVWRSPPAAPQRARQRPVVPIALPAGLLKTQHYALDLFERGSGKGSDFVSSYAFEVVRQ